MAYFTELVQEVPGQCSPGLVFVNAVPYQLLNKRPTINC